MTGIVATQFARTHGNLLLAVAIDPKTIGQRIAHARIAKGWTQLQFATEHAHVSPSTVARWEAGHLPPVRELMRISDVLGVDAETLVEPPLSEADQELLKAELAEVRRGLADLKDVKKATGRIEAQLRELLKRPQDGPARA